MAKTHRAAGAQMRAKANDPRLATHKTHDSFQNFLTKTGIQTGNLSDANSYGFNPISRNRVLLEWMYRGSWLVGQAVDVVGDDMTRAGIELGEGIDPVYSGELQHAMRDLCIWEHINNTVRWSRLYGGCLAVMLIEGQDPATPLNVETIGRNQFKGLLVLDRWMVQPTFNNLVKKLGPDLGRPIFYDVVADAPALPRMRIHYSRCLRMDGLELPYWQKISENLWGMSVIERLYDRLTAFDSTSQGAAQLVYKAYLRTMKVDGLRDIIAAGGPALEGLVKQVEMIRLFQSNEGLTLIDGKDEFDTHQYTFAGLSDVMMQFGQQVSGATQIPLVRLFGQSPSGLNSTGESDLRNYYDSINQQQESKLRRPMTVMLDVLSRSELDTELPDDFNYDFASLWQLSDVEKSDVASKVEQTISDAMGSGIIGRKTALAELRQSSRVTGVFTNISEEDIEAAEEEPPDPMAMGGEEPMPGDDEGVASPPTQDSAMEIGGHHVVIETPKGSLRKGAGWEVRMPVHYGYIRGTASAEGPHEQMDCFIGPNTFSERVWIIKQLTDDGAFDEHKVMLGFDSMQDAIDAYCKSFSDGKGPNRLGDVHRMTTRDLTDWLKQWQFGTDRKTP